MGRHRNRSRSRSYSPVRRKHYDDPADRRRNRRSPAPTGLLVRNISLKARPEDIRICFERFGPLKDVYLPKNYYTGEPRGFGFVKFLYPEDASEAKHHLNHKLLSGRKIRIVFAEENRKTPDEMRRIARTSGRGSYSRRSPSRSPRQRYRSYSRSPTPVKRDMRDRDHSTRDDYYSPRRSRSLSISVSPVGDKSEERSRQFKSMSMFVSTRGEANGRSRIPRANSQTAHAEDYIQKRSESPRGSLCTPSRIYSRSHSPR